MHNSTELNEINECALFAHLYTNKVANQANYNYQAPSSFSHSIWFTLVIKLGKVDSSRLPKVYSYVLFCIILHCKLHR
jgi:hypothetical protein